MDTSNRDRLQNRYPRMVHNDHVARLRAIMSERQARLAALKTRADAEAYLRHVRRALRKAFGPLPRRTPLKARIVGSQEYAGYRLEKVLFESRPGFLVTGNLYLPDGVAATGSAPGVLGLCGHSADGKMAAVYQSFCLGLVLKGFVVFVIDPIAQGERDQYAPVKGSRLAGCPAHNMLGNQMALVDDFFGAWRAWDGIRALDYLLSRPEVDKRRVGVTGNSGGGTLSSYVTALDPRLSWAAPSCYICSWLANLENELPSDSEQNPPGLLAEGLDEVDLLIAHAPRPTLILGQARDFFDPRYTRQAWTELRHLHRLLGSRDSAKLFIGPRDHGYGIENREAMYAFALRQAGLDGPATEPAVQPRPAAELQVTPKASVRLAGSRPLYDFTAERARDLAAKRGQPTGAKVRSAARRLLALPRTSPREAPHYRALRTAGHAPEEGIRAQFAVETAPGIEAIVTSYGEPFAAMLPPTGKVELFVGHIDSEDDVRRLPAARRRPKNGFSLASIDPRGIGQSMARTCGSDRFFEPYGQDFMYAALGDMLNECYLGRRVWDVMRGIDFLRAHGADEVRLTGRGLGSVTAAFAALLHPSEPPVELFDYLPSYDMLAQAPRYSWPFSAFPRGCLKEFDLPDVYRALGKRLTLRHPWDVNMRPLRAPAARAGRRPPARA